MDIKHEIIAKNEADTARRLKRNADRRIRKRNHREFIAQQTASLDLFKTCVIHFLFFSVIKNKPRKYENI